MKELDKTKKYDLSKLTDEQFDNLSKKIGYKPMYGKKGTLYYNFRLDNWLIYLSISKEDAELTCATELFEDEKEIIKNPYLTYEEKESLLNNKPMTKEETIKQINEHIDKCIQAIRNSNSKSKTMTLKDFVSIDDLGIYEEISINPLEKKMNKDISKLKTMTEEEKELWIFVYKESVKYQQSFLSHKAKADQAVKDFREALKM